MENYESNEALDCVKFFHIFENSIDMILVDINLYITN